MSAYIKRLVKNIHILAEQILLYFQHPLFCLKKTHFIFFIQCTYLYFKFVLFFRCQQLNQCYVSKAQILLPSTLLAEVGDGTFGIWQTLLLQSHSTPNIIIFVFRHRNTRLISEIYIYMSDIYNRQSCVYICQMQNYQINTGYMYVRHTITRLRLDICVRHRIIRLIPQTTFCMNRCLWGVKLTCTYYSRLKSTVDE